MPARPPRKKTARKIGFDLSILDRSESGTSVYADSLFRAMQSLDLPEYEIIGLRAPRPLPRRNILTKLGNFLIEISWLFAILPVKARRLRLDLLHMPANAVSPTAGVPQVCSIHDAHFLTNPEDRDRLWLLYARFTFRYAARHARRIICDSNSARDEIVELLGAPPGNIEVIPLGLTHRDSSPEDSDAAARLKPYILTVSATEPNKNFSALIEAYHRLIREGRAEGHRLIIAGPPGRDQKRLENMIRERSLGDSVQFTGRVSDSRLAALYENASVFAFPSLCEGFGFPPLEAMHYGVPVVASNAPCIPETLGGAPVYFDPHDVESLSAGIGKVISDRDTRQSLIEAGLKRADEFTWEKTAARTVAVYQSLLDGTGA